MKFGITIYLFVKKIKKKIFFQEANDSEVVLDHYFGS